MFPLGSTWIAHKREIPAACPYTNLRLYLTATIDDGEAATFAIAVHRKLQAATDDRGALRYVEQNEAPIQVVSTSQLLRKWAENNSDPDEIAETLRRIRDGGRFEPSQTDPNYGWWMKMLEEAP